MLFHNIPAHPQPFGTTTTQLSKLCALTRLSTHHHPLHTFSREKERLHYDHHHTRGPFSNR